MTRRKTQPGSEDALKPEIVSVEDIDDSGQLRPRPRHDASVSARLSGGDVDARWDQAEASGEETVGGSVSTPDQDVVDEIGEAVGVTYAEGEPLRVGEKEQERDEHRWELDPASSEDFAQRSTDAKRDAEPILKMKHRDQYK
jgi:hypothetical protein